MFHSYAKQPWAPWGIISTRFLSPSPLRKCAAVNDICEMQVMAMTAIAMTSFRAPRDGFASARHGRSFPTSSLSRG